MGRFGQEDMRDALLLVHLASSFDGRESFPEPVLETIGRLVRSDAVSYEEREILSHRVLALALRPVGVEYQLRLWLPAPPGIARYFSFNRSRKAGDFTERDRELLELLRPFLVARRERFAPPLVVEPDAIGLTGREAEILTWVARGKANKEIALLLLVSPHTVRKHLEHAYEKLGVHTRTAAVARATVLSTG